MEESRNMKVDSTKNAGGIILKVPNVQVENNNNNRGKELETDMVCLRSQVNTTWSYL